MDPTMQMLFDALRVGGPYGLSALLFYVWQQERHEKAELRLQHEQLQAKLLENAVAQIQATTKMEGAITALKDVLTQFLSKLG